jgi:uncharacterized membrane protein
VKIERLTGFATGLLSGVVAVALVLYLGSFVTAALPEFIALEPGGVAGYGGLYAQPYSGNRLRVFVHSARDRPSLGQTVEYAHH